MENKLSIQDLKAMTYIEVIDHSYVQTRFKALYQSIQGSDDAQAEMFFEKETHFLKKILSENSSLSKATGFSIYGVLMDIASMGITLENVSRPLIYILPANANVGTKDKPKWETRATVEISPYGELDLRIQAGQLLYADRPVVVYEGDLFQPLVNDNGQKIVKYQASIPRQSNNVIGSFIKVVRPNNSFDFFWMLPEDIDRLKKYSSKKNRGNANELYGKDSASIDTGFLEAKTIKHAFKTFPKLRLGQFSKLQEEANAVDYGLDEPIYNQTEAHEETSEEETPEPILTERQTIVDNPDEPF
ncbi:MAG: hypothetical protein ACRDDZ_01480 [Marinifilaceae bacterium]